MKNQHPPDIFGKFKIVAFGNIPVDEAVPYPDLKLKLKTRSFDFKFSFYGPYPDLKSKLFDLL